jgi:hypothetical protein
MFGALTAVLIVREVLWLRNVEDYSGPLFPIDVHMQPVRIFLSSRQLDRVIEFSMGSQPPFGFESALNSNALPVVNEREGIDLLLQLSCRYSADELLQLIKKTSATACHK